MAPMTTCTYFLCVPDEKPHEHLYGGLVDKSKDEFFLKFSFVSFFFFVCLFVLI